MTKEENGIPEDARNWEAPHTQAKMVEAIAAENQEGHELRQADYDRAIEELDSLIETAKNEQKTAEILKYVDRFAAISNVFPKAIGPLIDAFADSDSVRAASVGRKAVPLREGLKKVLEQITEDFKKAKTLGPKTFYAGGELQRLQQKIDQE